MAKVSIIVPCYNQAEYLAETLDSVLSQTYQDWECIVVNDGSSDNTKDVAFQYVQHDCRIKYIEQTHLGPSSARNNGIKISSGDFILPLDADDIIATTYIEKAIRVFEQSPNISLVYCKAEMFGEENGPWDLPKYNYNSFIWENCIFCSALFKRTDYNHTNGYNYNMTIGLEDWDFWLSLLDSQSLVYQIDEVLFYYRRKKMSRDTESQLYKDELYAQIYYNHTDIYEKYAKDIVLSKQQLFQLRRMMNQKIYEIYNSNSYKVGDFILKPFVLIKKIINKITSHAKQE